MAGRACALGWMLLCCCSRVRGFVSLPSCTARGRRPSGGRAGYRGHVEAPQAVISQIVEPVTEPMWTGPTIPEDSLFVLDGTSMLYKCYYSKFTLEGYSAEQVPLILFGMELAKVLAEVQPRYITVAFDFFGDPTDDNYRDRNVRRLLYKKYKANRDPAPVALRQILPYATDVVKALGIHWLQEDGVEADDVMATVSRWALRRNLSTVLVSEDKDLLQLVSDRVLVMHPRTRALFGPQEVERKTGVPPSLNADFLGLVGDQVDGIPGVRGVGPKTAVALLRAFGSLEGIYSSLDSIESLPVRGAKSLKKKLVEQRDEAFLYRQVATLIDNLDLPYLKALTRADLRYRGPHHRADELLGELGFMGPLMFLRERVTFDYW